jgi:divalent metal cation (Fe/Co/Zn/Cd) transporter
MLAHDASPENTAEVRTKEGLAAIPAKKQFPDSVTNNSATRFLTGIWQTSPVAGLFFALAGLFVINALFLRNRKIGSATRSAGLVAAAPAAAATGTAGAAMEGINSSVAAAVHAVDDLTPGA